MEKKIILNVQVTQFDLIRSQNADLSKSYSEQCCWQYTVKYSIWTPSFLFCGVNLGK